MDASLLDRIKKQASCYIQEKYRNARKAFTDVTDAQLLAEEATNSYPCSPDAKTMTLIAKASYDFDNFWRIVDVLHKRLGNTDWKQWRQSYKSLVLLEFLLTHGPEYFIEAFQCDKDVIQELGTFKHVDEKGFNWGVSMQKKSEQILELLTGGEVLKQARLKALKITKEIQGFGSATSSPLSSSPPSSSSPLSSSSPNSIRTSSFKSYTTTSTTSSEGGELNKLNIQSPRRESIAKYLEHKNAHDFVAPHAWNCYPIEENGSLLDYSDEEEKKPNAFASEIYSEIRSSSNRVYRSLSDGGQTIKKRCNRQHSADY